MSRLPREYTNKLIDMVDNGLISYDTVFKAMLNWMSEDDVKEMMEANDFIESEDEDEE
jgi:hypothetical protein